MPVVVLARRSCRRGGCSAGSTPGPRSRSPRARGCSSSGRSGRRATGRRRASATRVGRRRPARRSPPASPPPQRAAAEATATRPRPSRRRRARVQCHPLRAVGPGRRASSVAGARRGRRVAGIGATPPGAGAPAAPRRRGVAADLRRGRSSMSGIGLAVAVAVDRRWSPGRRSTSTTGRRGRRRSCRARGAIGCAGRPVFGSIGDARVEPVPRVDVVLPARVVLALHELAALVVLDRVHDARVVVAKLAPPHCAGRVEVLVEVRLAVVVEVADAADLVAGAVEDRRMSGLPSPFVSSVSTRLPDRRTPRACSVSARSAVGRLRVTGFFGRRTRSP